MSDLIEAGARALCESRYLGVVAWTSLSDQERLDFRADAWACLRAVNALPQD